MIHSWIEALSGIPFFSTPIFGIIAMIIVGGSWCLIGYVMGDAPKRGIEPSLVQFFGAFFSCLFSLIVLCTTSSLPDCPWGTIFFACGLISAGGFLNFFMLQIMSYAMQRGPNGIIWSTIQSALVFPFLVGIIFFEVAFTWLRLCGIFCLLAMLAIYAMTKDNTKSGSGWKIPAFCCLLIAGIQQNLSTMPSYFSEARAVNSITRAFAASGGTLLAATLYNLLRMTPTHWKRLKDGWKNPVLWRYIFALQFFSLIFAYTLLYPGMNAMADAGLGGMCYPMMVGSCIITFSLAAIVVLKEKFTLRQAVAMLTCIVGLILICTSA